MLKGLKTALSFKASYDTAGTWNFGLDLTETAGGGADTGMLETDLNKLVRDLSAAAEEEAQVWRSSSMRRNISRLLN